MAPIKFVTVIAALSSLLFILADAQANFDLDACIRASERCDFFLPSKFILPTVSLDASSNKAVTEAVQFRPRGNKSSHSSRLYILGILNANNIPVEVVNRRGFLPITAINTTPRLNPAHFKPFSIPYGIASGIGYETLTSSQRSALRGQCIRVFFTSYQVLNSDGTVKENVNNVPRFRNKCVVFIAN